MVTQSIEHDIISLANESNAWEFFYTGNVQEFIVPVSGYYKLECHGAGTSYSMGGYAEGTIYFEKNEKLYIYVGGQTNVFNGGDRAPPPPEPLIIALCPPLSADSLLS